MLLFWLRRRKSSAIIFSIFPSQGCAPRLVSHAQSTPTWRHSRLKLGNTAVRPTPGSVTRQIPFTGGEKNVADGTVLRVTDEDRPIKLSTDPTQRRVKIRNANLVLDSFARKTSRNQKQKQRSPLAFSKSKAKTNCVLFIKVCRLTQVSKNESKTRALSWCIPQYLNCVVLVIGDNLINYKSNDEIDYLSLNVTYGCLSFILGNHNIWWVHFLCSSLVSQGTQHSPKPKLLFFFSLLSLRRKLKPGLF